MTGRHDPQVNTSWGRAAMRLAVLLGALLLGAGWMPAADGAPARQGWTVSLNGTWQVQRTAAQNAAQLGADWQDVAVPSLMPISETPYAWYRREFSVPAHWSGDHVFLSFGGVRFVSKVYVNGVYVGGHLGAWEPFEIEATGACRLGETNELVVRVEDVRGVIEGDVTYVPDQTLVETVEGRVLAPVGSQTHLFGIWQGVELVRRADAFIEEAAITTSVRSHTMDVSYVLRNLGDSPRAVRLAAVVRDGDAPALDLGATTVVLPARGTAEVSLSRPWADAKLWMPGAPNLYHLESALSEGAAELDLDRTRFGFREFWTEGTQFVLNGVPLHFLAGAGHPPWDGRLLTDDEVRARFAQLRSANYMAVRLHANIWPENWYSVADEVGLPVILESAIWCYSPNYALANPTFWQNARSHWQDVIRSRRNHPCVVMYSIENEILHCGGDRVLGTEGKLASLGLYVKRLDPTRPIMYDGDENPDGAADVINLHYPHELPANVDYPNTAYWLDGPARVEGWPYRQWEWSRTKPLYIGEFLWVPSRAANNSTPLVGDEAFRDREAANHLSKAIAWEMQIEAYRAAGVAGMCPWDVWEGAEFDLPERAAVQRAYEPNAAFVREYDSRFFGGEQVERTVTLFNDTLAPADLVLQWSLGGVPQGKQAFSLAPAGRVQTSVSLTMPAVDVPTDAPFELVVRNGGAVVYKATRPYRVFPLRPANVGPAGQVRIAVYRGDGTALAFLRDGGAEPALLDSLASVGTVSPDMLVIDAHALDAMAAQSTAPSVGGEAGAALSNYVRRGGCVLVLEQDAYPQGLLPAELTDGPTTIAFRRAVGPANLQGAGDEVLRFWRGDNYVARHPLARPRSGGFRVLVDAGSERGLDRVLLMEAFVGQGRYVFSQLLLCEKQAREPMARLILGQLFASYARPLPARRPLGLVCGTRPLGADLVAAGVEFSDLTGTLASADLSPFAALIVDGSSPELTAQAGRLHEYVWSGGAVVLHGVGDATLRALSGALPARLVVRPSTEVPVLLAQRDADATQGLRNEDLYWTLDPTGPWWSPYPLSTEVLRGKVLREPPPLEECTVIEAEAMQVQDVVSPDVSGGQVALYGPGSLEAQVNLTRDGPFIFGLVGSGTPLGGVYPEVTVALDGSQVGSMTITGPQEGRNWIVANATAGAHTMRLSFANDEWNPTTGEDRNLFVDRVFLAALPGGYDTALLTPPGLVRVPDGAGRWLIDEVWWDGRVASQDNAARYLCGLLTNLNVSFLPRMGLRLAGSQLKAESAIIGFARDGEVVTLSGPGIVAAQVQFLQPGQYEFVVAARGTIGAGEYPALRLMVGGTVAGERQLQGPDWETLTYTAAVQAGVQPVRIEFTNDYWNPQEGEDRNVWIRDVSIRLTPATQAAS